jgi:hypothetical protein
MTTNAITFNPMTTTNALGSFSTVSDGLYQGTALDSPNSRFNLAGGVLNTTETLPMWGGCGIYEYVPASPGNSVLGGTVGRALTNATLTGFSVFDQAYAGLTTPQSPVPLYGSGMSVNFYRLGSGARLALAIDPTFAATLDGGIITVNVSWDFVNQKIIPYSPAYTAVTITGATWASTSGGRTTFTVSTDLTAVLDAGDSINVTGVVSTGGTGVGFNGSFVVVSVTSTTVVVTQAAASSPGTYSSGGTIVAGGGALAVKILQVQTSNCKTVSYNSTTGFATWNTSGACAIALI